MTFTITTWNVLAPAYVRPERYRGCDPQNLDARRRLERTTQRVRQLDSDIFLFQEVERPVFEALVASLPGHAGHIEMKRDKPDGSALFVRDRFAIDALRPHHYAAIEPGYDHVALAARVRIDGRPLVVASTHLRWQGREVPDEAHLGRRQMAELIEVARSLEGPAWCLGGDLNAGHDSPVLRTARDAGLSVSARSLRPWDTALINGNRRKLDHLLVHEAHLAPVPRPLPKLSRHHPSPSATEPSDHLPLTVDFTWN